MSTLLETSEKNLADAEARCRALEEAAGGEEENWAKAAVGQRDAEARAAAAEEKVSTAEQDKSELREEVCVCVWVGVGVCVWFVFVRLVFSSGCDVPGIYIGMIYLSLSLSLSLSLHLYPCASVGTVS